MEGLTITSGGRLLKTRWVYDESKDEGGYVTNDVTDKAPYYLFHDCTVAEDVVLRDVFLLLKRHMDIYKVVINRWVDEIVEEGLRPYGGEETDVKCLELYWWINYNEEDELFSGNTVPEFHGIGFVDEERYALELTPANELAGLPLTLCHEFTIISDIADENNCEPVIYKNPEFSLGQILRGIINELTFYGSPEERDRKGQELFGRSETRKAK